MTRTGWKRILAWLVLIVLVALLVAWLSRWWSSRGPAQRVAATAEQLSKGRYLAEAADCTACHTADGGAPFAGGVPLHTPFGTIHGTNITPDPDTGIGRYTADDFFHALTRGEARDGHQLYPAMPYVSYRTMQREDSDAIYAYLMNQPPVRQRNLRNGVHFPFNIRSGIHLWNMLFAGAQAHPASQGATPSWQRGRYLVDTLGHCGECHSPRGTFGQVDRDRPLAGNSKLGRFAAPDITPAGLSARGWDAASMRNYLATGITSHAVASDEMLKVVSLSTSRLSAPDVADMTTYLLGDKPLMAQAHTASGAQGPDPGRRHYLDLCSGCHGRDGEGVPNVAVRLRGNSSLRDADPHNLVVAILDGLPEHDFPGLARMQDMPGFAQDLSDADVAALSTWLRARYGVQGSAVDAALVRDLRRGSTGH
ncbi:mono/diheme cytochrome c family protein [Lysobacter niastensis]|uniref:Mono/diheme cytochrome c family protein n=1 Tax=Lysobacter niastensis TaxID=380629 RepID=A0ABU1W8Q7_9GAMM|nr:cytochrome c [Lysobacter niastensis]MDR7133735.1 mono/diheme cytochrome c family protein [Lysobacter niastensis]